MPDRAQRPDLASPLAPLRLVIVDDHPRFRNATALALSTDERMVVLAEGASACEALALVASLQPDVVLLDLAMPGGGLNAARAIREAHPSVKVVMLTFSEEEDDVCQALRAGVRGYVLKGVGGRELRAIVHSISSGAVYLAPALTQFAGVGQSAALEPETLAGFSSSQCGTSTSPGGAT